MIAEEKHEELIFDYLEGNLTPEEHEAFALLVDENEGLEHEVRLWKKAYITGDLPAVPALEQKLFIDSGSDKPWLVTRLLATALIALAVLSPATNWINSPTNKVIDPPESRAAAAQHFEPAEKSGRGTGRVLPAAVISVAGTSDDRVQERSIESQRAETDASSMLLRVSERNGNELIVHPVPPKISAPAIRVPQASEAQTNRKNWSRHQQRMLRKKLWSDQIGRKANEFQNGNEPYVVPLRGNNF